MLSRETGMNLHTALRVYWWFQRYQPVLSCDIFHRVSCLGTDMQKPKSGADPGLELCQIGAMK